MYCCVDVTNLLRSGSLAVLHTIVTYYESYKLRCAISNSLIDVVKKCALYIATRWRLHNCITHAHFTLQACLGTQGRWEQGQGLVDGWQHACRWTRDKVYILPGSTCQAYIQSQFIGPILTHIKFMINQRQNCSWPSLLV